MNVQPRSVSVDPRPALPQGGPVAAAAAGPAMAKDGFKATAVGAAPRGAGRFPVGDATERLIAAAGGKLEAAYDRALLLRDKPASDPDYQATLIAYSRDAGLTRPITADELRDVEHFLFAAAYTAGVAPSAPSDTYLKQVGNTLKREVTFASAVFATLGYSGAKVLNEITKATLDTPIMGSRTKPSWSEVGAGLRGAARGLTD